MYRCLLLLLLFHIPYYLKSQIFPKEDSYLNYRIIGFSFPSGNENGNCLLEIAQGNFSDTAAFKTKIFESATCKNGKIIAGVPFWGSDYTWRMATGGNNKLNNELHHFHTLSCTNIDTSRCRLRILQQAEQYKDAYVFVDDSHALYDMNGNAVWFLPVVDHSIGYESPVRDIKLTPQGTITFSVVDGGIYEINYDGDILWKGPDSGEISGDSSEHYHHEFTRLKNGHYMVAGGQTELWQIPGDHLLDSSVIQHHYGLVRDSNNMLYKKCEFGTVIEYDQKGNVIWSWKSAGYFKNFQGDIEKWGNVRFGLSDTHENSFYFDEESKIVYVSFRNISTIIKIKYPEGTVLAAYGNKYVSTNDDPRTNLFCGQHSIKHSKYGYLYLFNNNSCERGNLPKIEVMEEPDSATDTLKNIWEYQCTIEGIGDSERNKYNNRVAHKKDLHNRAESDKTKFQFTTGGNVVELPGQSIFASSSGSFCEIFIVNKDKKILWSSVLEAQTPDNKNWTRKAIYRASIIPNRRDLDQLIWNTEMKQQ